jgi:CRP-like cAMP-binding protein
LFAVTKEPGISSRSQNRPASSRRDDDSRDQVQNEVLLALPRKELEVLLPKLELVRLKAHQVLHDVGQTLKSNYFCNAGMFSQQVVVPDGSVLEVAVIGKEGFSAVPFVAGFRTAYTRTIVRTEAIAFSVEVNALKTTIQTCPMLDRLLQQYVQVLAMQMAQVAACNRFHDMHERLAKWLLMAYDRVGSDTLPLTQEFISQMLGTRRASVTVAAGILQKAGLISYTRGSVKILDREQLEEAACDCYGLLQRQIKQWREEPEPDKD